MANWDVYKPLGECSGSGRQMEFGEEYFGALQETEEGLQRRDFSVDYWEEQKPEVFCFWKTKLPHPEQKKKVFVDDEMLMAFFERLTDETEAERLNFRFVLALILMRKRRLKYESTKLEQGQELWRLRVVGDKRWVDVINPHLEEEQIEQLSEQMGQVLNADLDLAQTRQGGTYGRTQNDMEVPGSGVPMDWTGLVALAERLHGTGCERARGLPGEGDR